MVTDGGRAPHASSSTTTRGFRKVFTLGQFAKAVERPPTGWTGPRLLADLGTAARHADPALDIPDPYRRGPEAASGCVRAASMSCCVPCCLPVR